MSTHEVPPPWPVVNYETVDIEASEKRAASMPEPVEQEVDKGSFGNCLISVCTITCIKIMTSSRM